MRLSLLRNIGTALKMYDRRRSRHSIAMSRPPGRHDNDGLVDLFVCGEYWPPYADTNGAARPTKPLPTVS